MKRIAIVGTTGSGKTTLAEQLAARLGIPMIDLDALFWEANWTPTDLQLFRQRVSQAVTTEQWITSGNYSKARDLIWGKADTLVWLDYPLGLVLYRLLRRALQRIITQEELWGGNRETWRGQFLSRDSLFLYALRSHGRHRREYPSIAAAYPGLKLVHLHSPRQAQVWLNELTPVYN